MEWKEKGNEHFKAGRYAEATDCYSRALENDENNAVLYSNRSAAYLQLKEYTKALSDADTCLKLQPGWDKGHFRKGSALENIDLRQALAAYKDGLACNAENAELARKVSTLRQQLKAPPKTSADFGNRVHDKNKASSKGASSQGRKQGSNARKGAPQPSPNGAASHFMPGMVPPPQAWANRLSPAKQREWLVDCYRMRANDFKTYDVDCTGLYCSNRTAGSVLLDFLVFCRLALAHDVVPEGWDWAAFLQVAARLLRTPFGKQNAKEKWGAENVFDAMMGGRSLRYTAEVVYGSGIMDAGAKHPDEKAMEEELRGYDWEGLVEAPAAATVFRSVGGVAPWRTLRANVGNL
eukprot:jgi/Botrbrau1/3900/Bobra.0183s0121.1